MIYYDYGINLSHICNQRYQTTTYKGSKQMATANKGPKPMPVIDNHDDFGTPDEFMPKDDDGADSNVNANNDSLSLDDLANVAFNEAQDEAEYSKLNPPIGDWIKDDRFQFKKSVNLEDSMPNDIDHGRTYLSFSGKPAPRAANGMEYQPVLFLRISPDLRYKKDDPGKIDSAYKLCLRAKEAYLTSKGEKCKNLAQMVSFLVEDEYVLRTMNGDNGPLVVDIKAKR
jgi:hypothetical protein